MKTGDAVTLRVPIEKHELAAGDAGVVRHVDGRLRVCWVTFERRWDRDVTVGPLPSDMVKR